LPDRHSGLQMPALRGDPRAADAGFRRRQDPQDRTAQAVLAGTGSRRRLKWHISTRPKSIYATPPEVALCFTYS